MSVYVIWIDRHNAKLFEFSNEKMERKNLQARHQDHHTHRFDSMDVKRQELEFFGEVANEIRDPSRILILGPGMAKHHFRTYLVEHRPVLARTVMGCENVDHPTDAQIAALARSVFKISHAAASE